MFVYFVIFVGAKQDNADMKEMVTTDSFLLFFCCFLFGPSPIYTRSSDGSVIVYNIIVWHKPNVINFRYIMTYRKI